MKRRKGFVSNSSSSSFFINIKEFENTRELAEFMIQDRFEQLVDHSNKDSKYYKEEHKRKKRLLQLLKGVDPNENIAFKSCNFDTFLRRINLMDGKHCGFPNYDIDKSKLKDQEYYYVSTTNNVSWTADKSYPEAFKDGDIWDGLYDHVFIEGEDFLVLDDMKRIYVQSEPYACQMIDHCTKI